MDLEKITKSEVQAIFNTARKEFLQVGGKTTILVLTLQTGFTIVTSSSCIDPKNYDHVLGSSICAKRAMDKIWELEGYHRQSLAYEMRLQEEFDEIRGEEEGGMLDEDPLFVSVEEDPLLDNEVFRYKGERNDFDEVQATGECSNVCEDCNKNASCEYANHSEDDSNPLPGSVTFDELLKMDDEAKKEDDDGSVQEQ